MLQCRIYDYGGKNIITYILSTEPVMTNFKDSISYMIFCYLIFIVQRYLGKSCLTSLSINKMI